MPKGHRVWPLPLFQDDSAVSYARPATYQDWQHALGEFRKISERFENYRSFGLLLCAVAFFGSEATYLLGGWLLGDFVVLFALSALLSFTFEETCQVFRRALRKIQPAEPTVLAPLVALKIVGNEDLASRWEGVLPHAEQTSVPILMTDVDQFLSGPALRPPQVSASIWRSLASG